MIHSLTPGEDFCKRGKMRICFIRKHEVEIRENWKFYATKNNGNVSIAGWPVTKTQRRCIDAKD